LDRRLEGIQIWTGYSGKQKKNPIPCQKLNPGLPVHGLVSILTEIRFMAPKSNFCMTLLSCHWKNSVSSHRVYQVPLHDHILRIQRTKRPKNHSTFTFLPAAH